MWTCPKCERELKNPNQWHNCVKVSIDSLFQGKSDELVFLFDQLIATIGDWQNVAISATQNCIVCVHHQTFLVIRPMKKELDLKFYSENELDGLSIFKSIAYAGKYENHVRVSNQHDLTPEVFQYIRGSYLLL
jgi:hypothetical protein